MVVYAGNWNTVIPGLGKLRREVIDCWSQPELLQTLSQKNECFWKRELQWISIRKFRTSRETDTVTYTVYSFTCPYPHTHLWCTHMHIHTHTFIYSNASFTDIILWTLIYSTQNYTYSHPYIHCTDKHTEIRTPRTTWLPTHTTYTHIHSKLSVLLGGVRSRHHLWDYDSAWLWRSLPLQVQTDPWATVPSGSNYHLPSHLIWNPPYPQNLKEVYKTQMNSHSRMWFTFINLSWREIHINMRDGLYKASSVSSWLIHQIIISWWH